MLMRHWTWLAAAALVLGLCGCGTHRPRVTLVSPTFSYTQHMDAADAAALWHDEQTPDILTTRAASADVVSDTP